MSSYLRQRLSAVATLVASIAAIISYTNPTPVYAASSVAGLRSVDVMKYTKDVITGQPSDAEIASLVTTLDGLNITHIAVSMPLDATLDYPSSAKPSPRTTESFTQKWADTIHGKGLGVLWRGTFAGIEGIYNFTKRVGTNRFPAGTAASAANDGQSSWLGKIYAYIINHPSYFSDGDVWAPLPERTQGIFSDATSFLPYGGPGIQATYATFFNDLKTVSDAAFARIGKRVITGMSANNYSEVASTWLPKTVYASSGYAVVDYYGKTHTPAEMDHDLRMIAKSSGKPVFLQEWGDYWDTSMDQATRSAYLQSMYGEINTLVHDGVVASFNSWTGWSGSAESILTKTSSGYQLNYAGTILSNFFQTGILSSLLSSAGSLVGSVVGSVSGSTTPTPTPSPTPTSTDPSPSPTPTPTPTPSAMSCPAPAFNAFTGCYYSDQTLGNLVMTRTDQSVNFNWSNGTPAAIVPVDHFSVRWQGTFSFSDGTYTFTASADDGVRVFVDGQLVIDSWQNETATTPKTGSKHISTGNHIVKVEYFDNGGAAVAKVTWNRD